MTTCQVSATQVSQARESVGSSQINIFILDGFYLNFPPIRMLAHDLNIKRRCLAFFFFSFFKESTYVLQEFSEFLSRPNSNARTRSSIMDFRIFEFFQNSAIQKVALNPGISQKLATKQGRQSLGGNHSTYYQKFSKARYSSRISSK